MTTPRSTHALRNLVALTTLALSAGCSSSEDTGDTAPATGGFFAGGGSSPVTSNQTGGGAISSGGSSLGSGISGGGSPRGGAPGSGGSSRGSATGSGGSSGASSSSATTTCPTENEKTFSFFLISREGLIRESGKPEGPGGNFGGLAGADRLCQKVAEYVSPCQAGKVWHAFLSTSTVDAIDRIGKGPWRDRNGRLFAKNLTELASDRPLSADAQIKNDFPNEYGIPNSDPESTGKAEAVDNHQILTGSGKDGRLYKQNGSGSSWDGTTCGNAETWSVEKATCWDWTSAEPKGCPRVGHSWPGMSGPNWISVWNEGGCAPGGTLEQIGGLDGTRRVGAAGGYGGFYCFAVTP